MAKNDEPLLLPFTIQVDQQEKKPWTYLGIHADERENNRLLVVPTVEADLETGDYTVRGFHRFLSIERKEDDVYAVFGQDRKRIEAELQRMSYIPSSHFLFSRGWLDMLTNPPRRCKLNMKTIPATITRWTLRFPNVHFWFLDNRRMAEKFSLRLMRQFWKDVETAQRKKSGGWIGEAARSAAVNQ